MYILLVIYYTVYRCLVLELNLNKTRCYDFNHSLLSVSKIMKTYKHKKQLHFVLHYNGMVEGRSQIYEFPGFYSKSPSQ